ncbi:MAG TPA: hypothetical protein VH540_09935 [Ktedonobacterales bacterium]
MFEENLEQGSSRKRNAPRQQFKEDNPQAVKIAACVGKALSLLRGRTFRCTHPQPCAGQTRVFSIQRNSKIGQQDMLFSLEQNIAGLNIPMDQSVIMGILHRRAELYKDVRGQLKQQRSS